MYLYLAHYLCILTSMTLIFLGKTRRCALQRGLTPAWHLGHARSGKQWVALSEKICSQETASAQLSFDVVGFGHVDVGLVPKPEKVQG